METTHWADLAENFKIQDAACLMAGVPPVKELAAWSDKLPPEARYVFERLWKAYMQGAGVYRQPKLDSADFQKMLHGIGGNDFQAPTIAPARGLVRHQNMLIAPSAELILKRLESVRVSRDELHRWVKATGIRSAYSFAPVVNAPGAELSTQPAPAQTAATPAPVVAVGASGGVETDKAGPVPLTTGDIAFCFAGLRWKTESEWKKPLGDKPKWLVACIAIPGAQGVSATRWNPVSIGAALVHNGHVQQHSVRAKFQTMDLLKPWLEEWKTYEADNLATE